MQIDTARLQKHLKISQIMLRLAKEQKWTELWALQVERVKLFPDGLARSSNQWTVEQMAIINQSDDLDNQIQTALQKASGTSAENLDTDVQHGQSSTR